MYLQANCNGLIAPPHCWDVNWPTTYWLLEWGWETRPKGVAHWQCRFCQLSPSGELSRAFVRRGCCQCVSKRELVRVALCARVWSFTRSVRERLVASNDMLEPTDTPWRRNLNIIHKYGVTNEWTISMQCSPSCWRPSRISFQMRLSNVPKRLPSSLLKYCKWLVIKRQMIFKSNNRSLFSYVQHLKRIYLFINWGLKQMLKK